MVTPRRSRPKSTAVRPQRVRARLLIVEPDHLTMWSLAEYLRRWFTVETTHCSVEAEKLLRDHAVAALIVSDQLPGKTAETLAGLAQQASPPARVILMATADADTPGAAWWHARVEKPFDLPHVACLLGVADAETPPPPAE